MRSLPQPSLVALRKKWLLLLAVVFWGFCLGLGLGAGGGLQPSYQIVFVVFAFAFFLLGFFLFFYALIDFSFEKMLQEQQKLLQQATPRPFYRWLWLALGIFCALSLLFWLWSR